jgi:hypothetical protein
MAGLKEFIEKFDSDTELQKKVEAVGIEGYFNESSIGRGAF